ncbi:hypothetical protein AQUSIP_15310 [Aquicella siphonis]|uniref:Uncharacterized protein n=1 Tax=Aquicella siphonis TaxID=254247 RepID=A0A5E4PI07_9COXI|nr:hypothetical protein [Aquicella siphonis]VVC76225.1 hypothetical protein AQUSIP_15310 [Aquicella siphonis]
MQRSKIDTSVKKPDITDHIIELEDVLVKHVISQTEALQKALLKELETNYGEQLKEDHQPSLFDPHKTRHMKKSRMAKLLRSACQARIYSLADAKKFIALFQACEKYNSDIDPKGGCVARILNTCSSDIRDLDSEIYGVQLAIQHIEEYMMTILCHMKARELAAVDTRPYQYHSEEISRFTDIVIKEFERNFQTLTGITDQAVLNEIATQKVRGFLDELNNAIFEFKQKMVSAPEFMHNGALTSTHTTTRITEPCSSLKQAETARHIIELHMLPYLIRLKPSDASNLTLDDNNAYNRFIVFKAVIAMFAGYLKFEEKEFIVRRHQELMKDNQARLAPQEFSRKITWYANSLEEKLVDTTPTLKLSAIESFAKMLADQAAREDEEIEREIAKATGKRYVPPRKKTPEHTYVNYKDPLRTYTFIKSLEDVLFETSPLTAEAVCKALDNKLESHLTDELRDSTLDYEMRSTLNEWKRQLRHVFAELKRELVNAEKLLNGETASDDAGLKTDVTRRAVELVLRPVAPENIYKSDPNSSSPLASPPLTEHLDSSQSNCTYSNGLH